MKFITLVKATAETEAGIMPPESLFAEMTAYHEELAKAGLLKAAVEVRQFFERGDLPQSEALDRFRELLPTT